MADEIVHHLDYPDAEGLYHIACRRYWVKTIWTEPEMKEKKFHKCADGTYMSEDKAKVTCPECRAKIN